MKKALRIFGIITSLLFEVIFTYLMFVILGLGLVGNVLWIGIIAGLIGIVFGMVDLLKEISLDDPVEEEESKPPLYAKVRQLDSGDWYFSVYSQNHEEICGSDKFMTHDGAITGLWYLMDSMKKMNSGTWDLR